MSALDALRTRFEVEEKQKEIERLRYENEVSKKLLEHSEQIKNQNDELKQFSYAISHDLRAPLRSIKGFAQLLNESNKTLSEEDKRDYLGHIISGVGRLDALIRDLYAFTALNKPLEEVETNLNECLENVKKNLASLIRETNTQIRSDELPTIIGVPSRMEQVFQNILQNSIKYRREEEAPKLEVRFEKLSNHYRIMFKDNGRGIDSNFQDKAFQLFSRFQSEDAPGTGLGLAICQKVIQQMKGKIWLESNPGDGTMVTIELPA
jgi:signal transduction histidine kinase